MTRAGHKAALKAAEIVEIIPTVEIRPLPSAPSYIAGEINYRGSNITVIDLENLHNGGRCNDALSTRIVILQTGQNIFGIMAQGVTDTLEINEDNFLPEVSHINNAAKNVRSAKIGAEIIACYSACDLLPETYLNNSGEVVDA